MANTKDRGSIARRTEKARAAARGASTSTRDVSDDDTMLCDHEPCTCEEADVVRGGQRFCSERCADMAASAAEEMEIEEEETCMCGHAECEASTAAGAGGEERAGERPRSSPSRR